MAGVAVSIAAAATQSEIATSSSGDTEENLQKGMKLLEEVERDSRREHEREDET